MTRDVKLILLGRGVRGFAQGSISVLIAIYLHLLGFSTVQIGLFISAGVAGAALASLVVVLLAESLGRRRLMVTFASMTAVAALVLTTSDSAPFLILVALLGNFSAAGGAGAGPVQPLEQAALADTVPPEKRTDLYAVYGITGVGGASLGALAAGMPLIYQRVLGLSEVGSYKVVFVTFAVLVALAAACYGFLSPSVEAESRSGRWVNPFQLPSRRVIFTLSALFSVDNFAGGLVVQSLVSLWFYTRFFFGSSLMSAISQLVAAWLGNRFGLINTMVFTHILSNLIMMSVPFMPNVWLAAGFWLVRGFFGTMDVPVRQSYTMAVVGPGERSAMAGMNTLGRSVMGTVSPSVATVLWSLGLAGLPFVASGGLKIVYDLALYFLFRNVKPEVEARGEEVAQGQPR
ncbi:MAG: transporter [Dehalococcoidia bacterium]|nr:transporter [Dehalococcoidia bacterium]